jgi:hypothetical protein
MVKTSLVFETTIEQKLPKQVAISDAIRDGDRGTDISRLLSGIAFSGFSPPKTRHCQIFDRLRR